MGNNGILVWGVIVMFGNLISQDFEVKILIFIIGCFVSIMIINAVLRKVLNVERRKLFSYNFVNDLHKKGEWIIRISFVLIFTTISIYGVYNPFTPYFIYAAIAFGILLSGFRAIIEKKYAENPRDYLYTLSELGFAFIIIFVMMFIVFPEYMTLIF